MTYSIKEIFYTLQGEGANTGRPAVFCRFAGCNLWTGREKHRAKAICQFCDTEFVGVDGPGGGKFKTAKAVADAIAEQWPMSSNNGAMKFVVCTGGEPLLQLDEALISALHDQEFEVAVETNGTIPPPNGIDWLCVSPKARTRLMVTTGDELKLVYPQDGLDPIAFESLSFQNFFLQPMDTPLRDAHTRQVIEYCKANPKWRLSLQTHKYLGIP